MLPFVKIMHLYYGDKKFSCLRQINYKTKGSLFVKSKRIISLLLCIMLVIIAPISASAITYSDQRTVQLTEGEGWKVHDVNNRYLGHRKETANSEAHVKTYSLSMINNPLFRIVNKSDTSAADLVVYCKSFKMANADKTAVSDKNYAPKGAYCYANLKPSSLQTGTDTIKFAFSFD